MLQRPVDQLRADVAMLQTQWSRAGQFDRAAAVSYTHLSPPETPTEILNMFTMVNNQALQQLAMQTSSDDLAVSYTHLDVYKRQAMKMLSSCTLTRVLRL